MHDAIESYKFYYVDPKTGYLEPFKNQKDFKSYKFYYVDPKTGYVIPFNHQKDVKKWRDDNGIKHDTSVNA